MAKQNGIRQQPVPTLDRFPLPENRTLDWTASEVDQFGINAPEILDHSYTNHLHWVIQAFHSRAPNGGMLDVTQIELEAPDAHAALFRARQIFPLARNYRIASASEACSLTNGLHADPAKE